MKKYIGSVLVLISGLALSQTILNAKSPDEFRKMKSENTKMIGDSVVSNKITPYKYGFVEEKDVLKSITVWEIIDLNDKANQPYYMNNEDGLTNSSKSLYNLLLEGALSGEIKEVYDDENFSTKLSVEGINKRLEATRLDDAAVDIINSGRQLTPEEIKQYTDHIKTTTDKVKLLKIMGQWYIDKRDGMMKYRPLGIAAMGPDPQIAGQIGPDGKPIGNNELIDLFWIYYPDAREITANNVVFNRNNTSSDLTYDDFINARRFSAIIYKSSTGLGSGTIKDYVPKDAAGQLEESDRIKNQVLAMENEMWNY